MRQQLAGAHTLIVTARYAKMAPQGLDDSIWNTAQAAQLLVEGREPVVGAPGTVTTRALYTDDRLFFLFKWQDPTRSITKQSWIFNGQKWVHQKGNEDRIAVLTTIADLLKLSLLVKIRLDICTGTYVCTNLRKDSQLSICTDTKN